jgi:hypothetical protein
MPENFCEDVSDDGFEIISLCPGEDSNWMLARGVITPADAQVWRTQKSKLEAVVAPSDIWLYAVSSLYWAAATICTVGYGDISAVNRTEKIWTLLCFILGAFSYTYVISSLEDIVAQVDVTSSLFQRRIDTLTAYLRNRGICRTVQVISLQINYCLSEPSNAVW